MKMWFHLLVASISLVASASGCRCSVDVASLAIFDVLRSSSTDVAARVFIRKELPNEAGDQMRYFTANIQKGIKGVGHGRIIVATGAHSGLCGVSDLTSKSSWLLYGSITTMKVPGFIGELPVLGTAPCKPHKLFSSLGKDEKKQIYRFLKNTDANSKCVCEKPDDKVSSPGCGTFYTCSDSPGPGKCDIDTIYVDCLPQCGIDDCTKPLDSLSLCPDGVNQMGTKYSCQMEPPTVSSWHHCVAKKEFLVCP